MHAKYSTLCVRSFVFKKVELEVEIYVTTPCKERLEIDNPETWKTTDSTSTPPPFSEFSRNSKYIILLQATTVQDQFLNYAIYEL